MFLLCSYLKSALSFSVAACHISQIFTFMHLLVNCTTCKVSQCCKSLFSNIRSRHDVKVGPRPQDPGTRDLRLPLKFKIGTRDSLKFESGTPGPPSKFNSGTYKTSPFLNEFIFSEHFPFFSFLHNKM